MGRPRDHNNNTEQGAKRTEENAGQSPAPHEAPQHRWYTQQRRQFENIWLRTKRKDAKGKTVSATGGVCYLFFPTEINAAQRAVLADLGIK